MSQKIKLLVVEDEKLLLSAILTKLKKLGVEASGCEGGSEALEYLRRGEIPAAIWLDYYLKDMNGLEFVSQLKKVKEWATIPIVVVSNSASADKVNAMLALGIDNYLLKAEYRLDEIINIINKLIATKGQ